MRCFCHVLILGDRAASGETASVGVGAMSEELKDFASGLREILNRMNTPGLRPFVCDGSPLSCNVFLVGSNPATPMYRSFWEFWSDDFGFDKASFMQAYREARIERGGTANKQNTAHAGVGCGRGCAGEMSGNERLRQTD